MKDFASKSKELYLAGAIIGRAVVLQIACNVFIIVADVWRKYINRVLDRRNNAALLVQEEAQKI